MITHVVHQGKTLVVVELAAPPPIGAFLTIVYTDRRRRLTCRVQDIELEIASKAGIPRGTVMKVHVRRLKNVDGSREMWGPTGYDYLDDEDDG